MPNYVLTLSSYGEPKLLLADQVSSDSAMNLFFTCHNYFSPSVRAHLSVDQIDNDKTVESHALRIDFVDTNSDLSVYKIKGILTADDESTNSIVNVMDALDDFDNVQLEINESSAESFADLFSDSLFYNKLSGMGRNKTSLVLPTVQPKAHDTYNVITTQDDQPTVMYMTLGDDLQALASMVRVANRLNVRLWVELDPSMDYDQVVIVASELMLFDHHVCLLWSPILARPINAVGLKGKKVPRHSGGVILAEYLKRQSNTNSFGIPAIHRPVAGFDYPITFTGIQQNPNVVLGDPEIKKLADLMVNVVKRERFPNGIRFILNDCLTAYGDNRSVLKLANASEISMLIDSRLIEICKRHLLKHIEGTIEDTLKEAIVFMDACTSKERPLLRKSKEIGGYYNLNITPRSDRPHDAIDLECAYHPQGSGRAIFLKTTVTA